MPDVSYTDYYSMVLCIKKKIDDAECIQLPQYDYDSDYPLLQRFGGEQYFTPYGIQQHYFSVRIRTKSTIIKKKK